jgi:hypothetical protein
LRGHLGDEIAAPMLTTLVTERQVRGFEKLIQKMTGQGAATFSQQHRDTGSGRLSQEQYDKLSYSEKKAYAEQFQQPGR